MTISALRKVLVANRGEIALRIFHTCRELGLATVAVYSEADAASPHRFAADEAVAIGPPAPRHSYLAVERIVAAARSTGAGAVHPGNGFLAENADFARAVERAGLAFVGPTPEQIASMGDKLEARALMGRAGVPIIPGSEAAVASEREIAALAARFGYPLLVKAAGGGGGKGIRRVDGDRDLRAALERAASEAGAAFGDARVYVEKLIVRARHVEVQVVGDGRGNARFFGERECSLQRHHQKVLEETPSPAIDEETRGALREAALVGARAIRSRGAGTFEFLYDESERRFYFLEMNTRLQVEHPVTEMVTRTDLVAEQLRIAAGGALAAGDDPERVGHAIEFRVCAEDPYRSFAPSTGTIRALRLPHAPFTRIDAALREGLEIGPHYDPMLAKVIAWAPERRQAIRRLETILRRIRIGGIHTTIPLGIEICRWRDFQDGHFHTARLEEWLASRSFVPKEPPRLAIRLAGIVLRAALESGPRPAARTASAEGGAWGRAARHEGCGRTD